MFFLNYLPYLQGNDVLDITLIAAPMLITTDLTNQGDVGPLPDDLATYRGHLNYRKIIDRFASDNFLEKFN